MNLQPPFVGRVAEMAALEEALATAILGRGRAVVLSGEPGIGKTRLASELADRAKRRGARVLWGRCAADAEAPAYWAFVQILRPLLVESDPGELQQRFGPGAADVLELVTLAGEPREDEAVEHDGRPRSPAAETRRFRLFDTITSMLLAASAATPLVLVVDDLHAADPGCLQLVAFLASSVRASRVLLLATMRSFEARRADVAPILLGSLAREALSLSIEGWTREEVGALFAQRGHTPGQAGLVDAVHRASAGNPFFVGEILRLIPYGSNDPALLRVPVHVRQAVLTRIEALSPATTEILRGAAIAGLEFDGDDVVAVTASDRDSVESALEEAANAGFVIARTDRRWAFRHEIVHDVVYDTVEPARRRAGHAAAAAKLRRQPEGAAHHLLCARPDSDLASTLAAVLRAAEGAAAAMAFERAAGWIERGLGAIAACDGVDAASTALHGRLLLALGEARWSAGDLDGSRAAFDDAAVLAARTGDGVLLAEAALGAGGKQQRAHVQYDAAIVGLLESALETCRDAGLTARLKARLAYALYAAPGSRDERMRLATEALELVRGPGAAAASAVLVDARWALWGPDRLDEQRAIGRDLLDRARRCGDREAVLVEHGWQIVGALERGDRMDFDEALAAYRGGAAELRLPWYEWYATRFACLLAQVEGRLDDAERLAAEALAAGQRAGHPDAALAFGSQMLAIRLGQDRAAELEAGVESSVAQYPDVTLWRRLLARIRVARGRSAEAEGELQRSRAGHLVEAPGDFLHLPSLAMLAELASAAPDAGAASRVFDALRVYSGRQIVLGFGMGFLGPVDQYLGEAAAAAGRHAEARTLCESALAQSTRLGALRWAARARTVLRILDRPGVKPVAQAPSPASTLPPATLQVDATGWHGTFAGMTFRVGMLRGMVYLHALLSEPDREFHALELAALPDPGRSTTTGASTSALADRADSGDSGPLLDEQAKRAYRERLAELTEELDEAGRFADQGRVALIRAEIEALEAELSRAIGLAGRDRRGNAAAERARVAVAKRIRSALERLGQQSPELQRYLEGTVRTGVFCVYRPDPGRRIDWSFGDRF